MHPPIPFPSFALWRAFLDGRLFDYAGCTTYELPIPDATLHIWQQGGWAAQDVAEVLAGFLMGYGLEEQAA